MVECGSIFAINSYTWKCPPPPPPPVSSNTSAATQDPIYKDVLVVPLNPHDRSKSATTWAPAILQILLLLCPANSIPRLPTIKFPSNASNVVVTYNVHFILLVHVLSSFLGHPCFAFYEDDCTTRGVSHCGLAIYIKKVS